MNIRLAGVLVCALALTVGGGVAKAQEPDSQATTAVIEVTVWRSVANPASLYVSTRPEGGSWRTEDVALDMRALSRSGSFHQSNAVRVDVPLGDDETATVDVTVWRSVANPGRLYVSTRAEGGGWMTEDTALDMSALSRSGNFHRSNAVRVEVQLERRPSDARGTDFHGYIPSLGATVAALDFFESPGELPPLQERVYRTTFDRSVTRYITWQLRLLHPPPAARLDFSIETTIYRADGTVAASYMSTSYIGEGWSNSSRSSGWGSADGGFWEPGAYLAELAIGGEPVASAGFEVIDQRIPESEAFAALRETLPWARGPLNHDSRVALLALAGLQQADPALAASVASFPWLREAPDGNDLRALQQVDIFAREDIEVAQQVATYPWLADGVSDDEWLDLQTLGRTRARSASAGRSVAGTDWMRDSLGEDERSTLTSLLRLAERTSLADQIAAFPWMRDDLTEDERWMVSNLVSLAGASLPLASSVIDLPWFQDDVTEHERRTVWNLQVLAERDLQLASLVANLPWFQDDVTEHERWTVWNLKALGDADRELADLVTGLPWFQDDVTEHERWTVWNLKALGDADRELAGLVTDLPWFRDDVTESERWTLRGLKDLALTDHQLAGRVAGFPWFRDGITSDERWIVWSLGRWVDEGVDVPGTMPFLETLSPAGVAAATALRFLTLWEPEGFARVLEHPAVKDGITEDETVVVSTLYGVHRTNPDLIETLLDPASVMLENRAVTLPLAGEVTLTVVRTKPGMERTMDLVEGAVGAVEELMGSPLPSRQVTFLFEDAVLTTFFGTHYGTHIALSPKVDSMSMSREEAYRPIVHEVAHYYWTGHEPWVNEGVANLLETVANDTFKDLPERDAVFPCPYARYIADLEAIGPQQRSRQFLCSYSLGERLFRDLYRKLGEDFWDGLQRLYQKSQAEDESDDCEGTSLGACHVEAAFKEGGSQEVIDIVDEVFDFWYEKREPEAEDSSP